MDNSEITLIYTEDGMNEAQMLMFAMTSLLVILSPGQDMLLVMSRGMTLGSKAGIVTAGGVGVGLLGHTALATLGVGALLMASEFLFTVLKYLGAAYLVYLGIRLLLSASVGLDRIATQPKSCSKMFVEGAISNISNPKITIFYFSFLPQFISSDVHNPAYYLLLLGVGFSLLTLLVKVPIGYFAGTAATWIRSRPTVIRMINRVSGSVLVGFGIKLAMEDR